MSAVTQNATVATALTGLARALVQQGKLRPDRAENFARKAAQSGTRFIDELVKSADVTNLGARAIAKFAADTFGHPLLDLGALDSEQLPTDIIDKKLVGSLRVLALRKRGNRLAVAVSDPTDFQALDQIKFQTQLALDVIVVEHDQLMKVIETRSQTVAQSLDAIVGDDVSFEDLLGDGSDEDEKQDANQQEVDDAPVVRFLQKLLLDAISEGASDLHFEPYEKFYRIRLRIDGVLRDWAQPPLAIKERLTARIKVISKLDISEKRVPQDGRMKLALSGSRAIDFRVSTLPTLYGEKIVMRILDPSQAKLGIDALGYDPDQKQLLLDAVQRPYGMVLVTGPTGSGKTVSLYTCLNILNQPGVNISTAEDPAEIQLAGINQVNVNEKAGLTFAAALRAFLRQDPDVIMVGEIRDLETADIAIKAAQTGHMVLSTLHTNDGPSTLTRLANMGVAPFNIASSVILITAQRLGRRLCTCKQPLEIDREGLLAAGFLDGDLDGSWVPYKPVGCDRCKGSGYKGRVGIYQVMPITENMQDMILKNAGALDLAREAERNGVNSLRRSGLLKVKQGLTSIEEVLGVTNE
ncbi:MAG TPA: type IV-A pilus assembly ATPase PilB [Burkholderiaceae bacterium]|nr:type IV-A pilus assembly ATPase PilB [Burkholderiaceae bacterium]HPE00355.1 type IV-A pilus assembly ATPase PilB [Burkholderiaceae bacterium]HRY99958.1 type IV-A pilus assembly ATPase PilB [Burkholderiaceae bacterium]